MTVDESLLGGNDTILKFGQTQIIDPGYIHIIRTTGDDIFNFDGRFFLSQLNLDGGGGTNSLSAVEGYSQVTFIVNADGSITSNQGEFANFQQFNLRLVVGNDVVTTGVGDDTISASSYTGQHNVLDGGGGNDKIYSGAGDDLIRGSGGDDLLSGGDGNDVLNGGDGNDILDGGNGFDTASYRGATAGVHVAIIAGQQDTGGAGLDLLSSIENLTGSSFNDKLTGDAGANTLIGAQGDDRLIGGGGNDVLEGDAGKDQLTGGAGADQYVFATLADFDAKGGDKITDFSHADGDTIDLSAIDPDSNKAGDQSFTFIGSAAFTKGGGDYELRAVDKGNGTYVVQGDVNHDGHADFSFVVVSPSHTPLVAADFHL